MTEPTRSKEELISSFSHKDVTRPTPLCAVCGTRCGSAHTQGKHANGAGPSTSRGSVTLAPGSPAGNTVTAISTTPIAKDKTDGNIYFECTNCQKRIASNRYAPHLSGCLGIGTGFRRGDARNASAKGELGAEVDRGGSPFPGSDYRSPSRESINGKTKVKPKSHKKATGKINDLEINGSQKRAGSSLSGTPTKKTKKKEIADEKVANILSSLTKNTRKIKRNVGFPICPSFSLSVSTLRPRFPIGFCLPENMIIVTSLHTILEEMRKPKPMGWKELVGELRGYNVNKYRYPSLFRLTHYRNHGDRAETVVCLHELLALMLHETHLCDRGITQPSLDDKRRQEMKYSTLLK
ncbi:hypothetical protein BU17DRAFT_71496 [Hysterangium stoloniferum]|nr:hypothetical protein BU17DRAFT_71496 [Hysterangium stoloniferum]